MGRRRATERKGLRHAASQQRAAQRRRLDPVQLLVTVLSLLMALFMTYLLFNAALPNLFN